MTFGQGLLFVGYYAALQAVLVAIAGLFIRYVGGVRLTWAGLLAAFVFLAACGPAFACLVCWARRSRGRRGLFALQLGLAMCAMVALYATAVALASRALGVPFLALARLPSYFAATAAFGIPIWALAVLLVRRARPSSQDG